MIEISIETAGENIRSFICSGHSGYAEEGSDIVCAAVTSAVRLAEATISDIIGVEMKTTIRPRDAYLKLVLPGSVPHEEQALCQIILSGLALYMTELRDEYPDFIQVMEV